ncbi:DUF4097 domain-containing protein [Gemmatimonadota bacterium]
MRKKIVSVLPLLTLCLASAPIQTAHAQTVRADDEWCDESQGNRDSERYCEVREFTLDTRARARVDAKPNGGIRVEGWDRDEILLRARVSAWTRRGDPQSLVGDIRIETGETISAHGPRTEDREGWAVSFRLMVPRSTGLDLESMNGGISIAGVYGDLDFETLNGGVTLEDVGGDVRGRTTNGGVNVQLSGTQWDGSGLDVQTTNGGVTLELPGDYRATLQTGTVNGRFHTDFPITVRGELRSNRITTELNGGGPTIRAVTTNGSVHIRTR